MTSKVLPRTGTASLSQQQRIFGLTGGIACGKSTAAEYFRELGFAIVDIDRLAHELYSPDKPLLAELTACFGESILQPDGLLNRKVLGGLVFADRGAMRRLEGLVNPALRALVAQRIAQTSAPFIMADGAMILENNLLPQREKLVCVYVPPSVQIQRLIARDGLDEGAAKKRLSLQMPIEEKARLADYRLDNSGTLVHLRRQVEALAEVLLQGASGADRSGWS